MNKKIVADGNDASKGIIYFRQEPGTETRQKPGNSNRLHIGYKKTDPKVEDDRNISAKFAGNFDPRIDDIPITGIQRQDLLRKFDSVKRVPKALLLDKPYGSKGHKPSNKTRMYIELSPEMVGISRNIINLYPDSAIKPKKTILGTIGGIFKQNLLFDIFKAASDRDTTEIIKHRALKALESTPNFGYSIPTGIKGHKPSNTNRFYIGYKDQKDIKTFDRDRYFKELLHTIEGRDMTKLLHNLAIQGRLSFEEVLFTDQPLTDSVKENVPKPSAWERISAWFNTKIM